MSEMVFEGVVHTWNPLNTGGKSRRWIMLTIPFGEVNVWFYKEAYDHTTGKGFQRQQMEAHSRSLSRAMSDGEYTPVAWCGGLTPAHEKTLTIQDGMAYIKVKSNQLLPMLDGGHRWEGLKKQLQAAQESGDQALATRILNQDITIQIFLESAHVQRDFMNLQKGRAMDRNQLRSMEIKNQLVDSDKLPVFKMATDVCHVLSKDNRSHLYGQIKFDSRSVAPMAYNSITTMAGSDLGTSISGGVKIAQAYNRDVAWLAATYVEAFDAIQKYGAKQADGSTIVMSGNRLLHPTILGGSRGGSALLIMVGNMLAFRKGFKDKDRASDADQRYLAETVDSCLNKPTSGQSGEDKRRESGAFARNYFSDLILQLGEKSVVGKLAGVDGVPLQLVRILSPSTVKVDKVLLPKSKPQEPVRVNLVSTVESVLQAGKLKTKPTLKAKKEMAAASGVQG
jgi:hypothetical protein